MFWNINLASDSQDLVSIGKVLRDNQACIVGLSEVPWSPDQFAAQASTWGYRHSLLLKTDRAHRFNMGLVSHMPLHRSSEAKAKPFFHGVLAS